MTRNPVAKRAILALFVLTLWGIGGCLRRQRDEPIALTWWVTCAQDSAEYPAFKAIADDYAERTGHTVELVSVPWSDIAPRSYSSSRLLLLQEEGRGPDVWGPVPHGWTGGFVADGQVLALEPAQVQESSQYVDAALQAGQVGQKQYGLPILMDSVALIYNRKLIPTPPASGEELLALARSLTDAKNDRWGLVLPLLSQYHTYPFMEGYGGYVFQCTRDGCDPNDIGLNNEGAAKGIQFLSDLYLKEKLFPEPLTDQAVMDSYALRLFSEGRAAMLIDGPWSLSQIRASGVEYGVSVIPPLPGATRPPRPFTVIQAVYVSSRTAHPAEAVDLANHLASPSSALALQKALGKTPVRRDVLRSSEFRTDREVMAWYDQAAIGVPLPSLPEMDMVWQPWGQSLAEAVPGLTPVQDALDRAVKEIVGSRSDAQEKQP